MTTFTATFSNGTTKTRNSRPGLSYSHGWSATVLRADGSIVATTYGFSRDAAAARTASVCSHGWARAKDGRRVVGEVVEVLAT